MSAFFEKTILNSPYVYPDRHWELDKAGQPTGVMVSKPTKTMGTAAQWQRVIGFEGSTL